MGLLPHGGLHPLPRVSRFSFCRHSLPRKLREDPRATPRPIAPRDLRPRARERSAGASPAADEIKHLAAARSRIDRRRVAGNRCERRIIAACSPRVSFVVRPNKRINKRHTLVWAARLCRPLQHPRCETRDGQCGTANDAKYSSEQNGARERPILPILPSIDTIFLRDKTPV